MKRRAISILILLLSVVSAFAQSKQSGYVKQYNEKLAKTPLGGVELNMYGAASTVSDSKGAFTLSFNTLKAGDKIGYSKIAKAGYVLFNKEKLDQWNISKDNKPFTIIMCQEAKFKAIKDNYMKVSSASYARQQKKEEAALEAEYKAGKKKEADYKKELYELKQYYAEQLKNIDTYVDQFSRIDLSELDAQEQAIIDMIQAGNVESAINKYETLNYLEKYEKEVKEVRELESIKSTLEDTKAQKFEERDSVYAIVMRQVDAYKLAGGKDNFEKAGKLLKECADADTNNVIVVFDYANFLYKQGDYSKSLRYFEICHHNCSKDLDFISVLFNSLGINYGKIGDLPKGENYLEQNRKIIDSLLSNNADSTYVLNLKTRKGMCLLNLGTILSCYFDYHKRLYSHACFLQCESLFEELYRLDSKKYWHDLAIAYNGQGSLWYTFKEYNSSENYYLKSLNLYKKIDSEFYAEEIADLEMNIGIVRIERATYKKAEEYLLQSYSDYKILAMKNPQGFLPKIAFCEGKLGILYKYKKQYKESEYYYNQSLLNYLKLGNNDPKAYISDIAKTYSNLGNLYLEESKIKKSKENYLQSAKYFFEFASDVNIKYSKDQYSYNLNISETKVEIVFLIDKLVETKDYKSALYFLSKLISLFPDEKEYQDYKNEIIKISSKK